MSLAEGDGLGAGAGEVAIQVFDVEKLETAEVYDLLDSESMRRRVSEAVRRSLSVNPDPTMGDDRE